MTLRIPLLNLITLDEETQKVIDQLEDGKKSGFVREAIVSRAGQLGFERPTQKPPYVPLHKWQAVQKAEAKNRSVDYSYVVAYFWLKSLPEYSYRQKSEIVREAIKALVL